MFQKSCIKIGLTMSNAQSNELQETLISTIDKGGSLMLRLEKFNNIKGIQKLEKKIQQEVKFLKQFNKNIGKGNKTLKEEHLKCSNLFNLEAIVNALEASSTPVSVLQVFNFKDEYENDAEKSVVNCKKICVDIVSGGGSIWNKVIARSSKALKVNAFGGQQYGQKSVLQQIDDFVYCAHQNPHLFFPPKVNVVFHNGVSSVVASSVEKRGAKFVGNIIEIDSDSDESELHDIDNNFSRNLIFNTTEVDSSTLNLDITAMIVYVSALTNGHSNYTFQEPILTEQGKRERHNPAKKVLDSIFEGKKLVSCQSAVLDFTSIVDTLGGEGEKLRAKDLLENRLHAIVPDNISEGVRNLELSDQIKDRSKSIFGTGDSMKIVTVTANKGFVRAAKSQGLNLAVVIHESRALTESKMKSAVKICD